MRKKLRNHLQKVGKTTKDEPQINRLMNILTYVVQKTCNCDTVLAKT